MACYDFQQSTIDFLMPRAISVRTISNADLLSQSLHRSCFALYFHPTNRNPTHFFLFMLKLFFFECFFGIQAPIAFLIPNQGISDEDLANLEVTAYGKDAVKSERFSDPCIECAICITEFKEDEEIRILNCDHRFVTIKHH